MHFASPTFSLLEDENNTGDVESCSCDLVQVGQTQQPHSKGHVAEQRLSVAQKIKGSLSNLFAFPLQPRPPTTYLPSLLVPSAVLYPSVHFNL